MGFNFNNLLTKIKVVLAIGKVVFTDGKTAKILDDADKGADIAAAVKDLVKPPKTTNETTPANN